MKGDNKYEIVIQDTCILFDLIDLDLLESFFHLELHVFTTPQVIGEVIDESQKTKVLQYVSEGKLLIDSNGTYEDILVICDEYSGLSFTDGSVIELAIRKEAAIFSSDGRIRKVSQSKNHTVRGTLWIIEELFIKELIAREAAVEKLNKYGLINQRAPAAEIKKLVTKLNNK